jgi:calcium-dependent protein kinase
MASQLVSKGEKEKLAQMFKTFDKNGDGRLDKKEIQEGYEKYHSKIIGDDEIDTIFGQIDVDGSGYIDYTEFVASAMNMEALMTDQKLKRAFDMFDNDGSGCISADEIRDVLGLTDNEQMNEKITQIISQVDENGDGEISITEFKEMMRALADE